MSIKRLRRAEYSFSGFYKAFGKYTDDSDKTIVFSFEQALPAGSQAAADSSSSKNRLEDVGAAVIELQGNSAMLRYIVIDEAYRGMGLSNEFITDILFELSDLGFNYFYINILNSQNPKLMSVAKRLEMDIQPLECYYYRFKLDDLKETEVIPGIGKNVLCFEELNPKQIEVIRELVQNEEDRPAYDPIASYNLDKILSVCHLTDDVPDGAIFVDRIDDLLYISFACVKSTDSFAFQRLFLNALYSARSEYPGDTTVEFSVSYEKLAEYIKNEFDLDGERMYEAGCHLNDLDIYSEEEL